MARPPVFLERRRYRRRRLIDAARLLPLVGAILFVMPILWAGTVTTSGGIVYIFAVWAVLIVAVGVLARPLNAAAEEEGRRDEEDARR